jgi:hypothetical protein
VPNPVVAQQPQQPPVPVPRPAIVQKLSDHYKLRADKPVNYVFPQQVSYDNPITQINHLGYWNFAFKMLSGDKTAQTGDDGFQVLDWT